MQTMKKVSLLLLTLVLLVQLFAGCNKREEEPSSSATEATKPSSSSSSSKPESSEPDGDPVANSTPEMTEWVTEFKTASNSDTVGWIAIPGTNIDDAVVQKADDQTNEYYMRRNYDQTDYFNGVYWADYVSKFGDGTREQLGVNTTIYGHAITDIPEDNRFNTKFGNLHKFRDEQFAKEHPYINFSTEKEDMAFEVIAVMACNADNPALPYNSNPDSGADFVKMIKDEVFPRSKYDYNVELNDDDKFLTLSTCIYTLDNDYFTNYPNTYFRYVIVGRLVSPDEAVKEMADLKLNPNVLYDNDGQMRGAA